MPVELYPLLDKLRYLGYSAEDSTEIIRAVRRNKIFVDMLIALKRSHGESPLTDEHCDICALIMRAETVGS